MAESTGLRCFQQLFSLASKFAAVALLPCSLRCYKELADKNAILKAFLLSAPHGSSPVLTNHTSETKKGNLRFLF